MSASLPRRAAAVVLALLSVLAIAALSRVPWAAEPGEHALLRLSWRTPGELVQECRRPSAEELARTPVHMRREEICEGRMLPRRLTVRLDGRVLMEETVRAAGAREDRPLYVFREVPLPPGEYRLRVVWETEGADDLPPQSARAGVPPPPRRLELSTVVRLTPRDVALVTYDLDQRELVARGPAAR